MPTTVLTREFVAPRYLTRFRCIGPECEATCCAGWRVPLSRDDHQRLKRAFRGTPGDRETFRSSVSRSRDPSARGFDFASVALNEDDRCVFLREDDLCSVQARHGEPTLPLVCSQYPRVVSQVGSRVEVTGLMSCPEMARALLLEDDALELTDIDKLDIPRADMRRFLPSKTDDPYVLHFEDVRLTVMRLLLRQHPFATRMFLIAYFANRLDGFFRTGATECDEATLTAELRRMESAALVEALAHEFRRVTVSGDLAAAFTEAVLVGRTRQDLVPEFAALVQEAYDAHAHGLETELPQDDAMKKTWEAYRARAAACEATHGERIGRYFTNFSLNWWLKDWYTEAPSLLHHVRRLLLHAASARFLLFGDRRLAATADDRKKIGEILDERAVRCFYLLARNTEHDPEFMKRVEGALDRRGLGSFAHVASLSRF